MVMSEQRTQLPTRDDIKLITSVDTLHDMLSDIDASIVQIETDLEFRNDDAATEDWDRRARGALVAHKICRTQVNRQIGRVQGKRQPPPQPPTKHEAATERAQAETERNKVALALSEEKTKRMCMQHADRQSFLGYFHRAAIETLPPETMDRLMRSAREALRQ